MAGRPDRGKEEILTEEQLKQLRHNLAHLSPQHVQDFYERTHQDCRMVNGRPPGDAAYGVPISKIIEESTNREVLVGSVYAALERLEAKGFVLSEVGEPTPERGGRAKRYFRITDNGLRQVRDTRGSLVKLWKGIPALQGGTR